MWRHDKTTITDEELLEILRAAPEGSIAVLDGPSGCGKTRLLKQLEASGVGFIEVYSVEVIRDLIMERRRTSFLRLRELTGDGIIAIEDIDFLGASKSLQIEAAVLIERTAAGHAVIITGIQLGRRIPTMMKALKRYCDNLMVWKYQSRTRSTVHSSLSMIE